MPAVGVRRQNKSGHTKNFSRGYRCSDGVAKTCPDWLDPRPVTLPGRARVPGCPLVQRSRCAGCGGTGSFSMEGNAALRFLLLFLHVGFAVSVEQMIATADGSLQGDTRDLFVAAESMPAKGHSRWRDTDQKKEPAALLNLKRKQNIACEIWALLKLANNTLSSAGRLYDGGVKPKFNVNQVAITQVVSYNLSRKGQWERGSWRPFTHSHYSPLNVTVNGIPCILFWAKRIMIKFENHTQLDLTEKTFGVHATVDVGDSNCSEDSAMLSLKFGDIGNLKGLVIRFLLTTSYYQLSVQNWFSLHRLQLLYNHSIQATFNATRIYAPASYSYHCEHVSSLQRYDALLIPSSANDLSKLWEVTFTDFQIQGFNIQEGHFAYAKDCASFFSPAILMGLVMSLILLLVLAYALHMLIHLKSLDRHYECKASPAYFAQMKDNDMGDEKEPLRSGGNESYELRNQQFCKIYI
nr:PREDICTED: V-type proton ATPase subunit S1-like protein [Balearica regulorum gibbericeps]